MACNVAKRIGDSARSRVVLCLVLLSVRQFTEKV